MYPSTPSNSRPINKSTLGLPPLITAVRPVPHHKLSRSLSLALEMTPRHPYQEHNASVDNTNNNTNNTNTNANTNNDNIGTACIHDYDDDDDNHDNNLKTYSNEIPTPFKRKRQDLSGLVTSPTSINFQNTQLPSSSEWSSTSTHSNRFNSYPEFMESHRRRNASLSVLESKTLSTFPSSPFQHQYSSLPQHNFSPVRKTSDGSSLYPFSDTDSHAAPSPPSTSTTHTTNTPWQSHQSPVHLGIPLAMALPSLPAIPSTEFNPYTTGVHPQPTSSCPDTPWSSIPFESPHQTLFENSQTQSKVNNERSSDLKVSHKLAERKRRKEMKELFDELRLAIPSDGLIGDKNPKISKWETLSRAVDFLYQVQNENKILREENKRMKGMLSISIQRNSSSSNPIPCGLVASQ
ncbi:uncharacterized protein MELLADRAFT_89781 [Melampsora larici-populina 98AG31]|uniref:BHLH domain-containing protein n=1 Tax=Melampsora larici-populina (strain 98AG31 / pathotype 3-4-7) TaxID=747676 RepID=F4RUL9_MELLP|nr:uncharacterized protein MELLADRAFT_89781 [Melampsora larici-populina 98AG31]EGG03972.1 hypothetical protein MELLADRAFT_89781 [Melampsora larici-populina 98AG31]